VAVLLTQSMTGEMRIDGTELACLFSAHFFLIALVFLAPMARREGSPFGVVLAEWYPLVVLLAVYGSIGLLNGPRAVMGQSFDPVVLRWEDRLLGSFFPLGGTDGNQALHWSLGLSYLAFFPMVLASPLVLWWMGRRDHARRAIFGITLTFFTCYILFLLFPVAGPAYIWGWPEAQTSSSIPVRLVRGLNDNHDSWGSAFPSSHVAASAAAVLLGISGCRRLGMLLLPFAIGILGAVVYFRVHYVLDAIAGLAVAVLAAWIVKRHWRVSPAQA
jgi:membrane-associated phospholipid phosphatase